MLDPRFARIQCFVDDAIIAVIGTAAFRRRQALKIVLWWTALQAKISWPKVTYGFEVEWIGVLIRVEVGKVIVTLPTKKLAQLEEATVALLKDARGMVSAPKLRALTGLGSWIGGVRPPSEALYYAAMGRLVGT